MSAEVQKAIEHHWALDSQASSVLAERIEESSGEEQIWKITAGLGEIAVAQRDLNRERLGNIFTKQSEEKAFFFGPCSLDAETDYDPLFDYIQELQVDNPDVLLGVRLNGAKPRTSGGWTGLMYSTNPTERQRLDDIYRNAFERGLPIVTEVTENTQLGALAPWLSGAWAGARDMQSTAIRSLFSAYHLPTGIKNSLDGNPNTVEETFKAIGKNSKENDGSGVNIGTIASSSESFGIPTGVLPVENGNNRIAIFARGHNVDPHTTKEDRRWKALQHLSHMCVLAEKMGSAVIIDGSHGVPQMFDLSRKDPYRLIPVLEEIHTAVEDGEIAGADSIAGVMGEVGPETGKTDPNFIIDDKGRKVLATMLSRTVELIS
jgi:phospho-2-dehydro-3-deoxyheptonate aldolase